MNVRDQKFSRLVSVSVQYGCDIVLVFFVAFFVVVLLRNTWVTEDAYITFRTVDNFVNGYGLRWNVAERVQAYTNPLWMFLVSAFYLFTHEVFYTSIALSVVLSLVTVFVLVFGIARSLPAALLGVIMLSFSKAFMDFSASGMENPLSHLIIILFLWVYLRHPTSLKTLFSLCLLAAFGAVNRIDLLPLFIPVILWEFITVRQWRRGLMVMLEGFLPFILWELFSLFYYGFLFPNTAYAKIQTGVPVAALVTQGFYYLLDSLTLDPLTLLVISVGLAVPFVARQWRHLALVGGIVLYLAYIVRIGGDFMSGRFLTSPFLAAVGLIVGSGALIQWSPWLAASGLVVLLGLVSPRSPVLSGADYGDQILHPEHRAVPRGIADERGHYFQTASLLRFPGSKDGPAHSLANEGRALRNDGSPVVIRGLIGQTGYYAGPAVYIVDPFALADPLLARLPISVYHIDGFTGTNWRIGHFARDVPPGYYESLVLGKNVIRDPDLAAYYSRLAFIIRGELWSLRRLVEIVRFNGGVYEHLRKAYMRRV